MKTTKILIIISYIYFSFPFIGLITLFGNPNFSKINFPEVDSVEIFNDINSKEIETKTKYCIDDLLSEDVEEPLELENWMLASNDWMSKSFKIK